MPGVLEYSPGVGDPYPEPGAVEIVEAPDPAWAGDAAGAGTIIDLTRRERGLEGGLLGAARWQLFAKRAIDIVGSMLLLVVVLPVAVVTGTAIMTTSRGPLLSLRSGSDGVGDPSAC